MKFELSTMQHATLPDGRAHADHSIAAMDEGQGGWAVPWAMYTDNLRRLWLNGNYTIHDDPGGTVQMWIWRDADGWHVDATRCQSEKWGVAGYLGKFTSIAVATCKL